MQYYYSSTGGFFIEEVCNNIPSEAVLITEIQYREFFEKQSSGKYQIKFITNEFIYTEIPINQEENAKQQRIIEAKQLLEATDWRALPDKFTKYPSEKQTVILEYREQLREVIRGNLATIPQLPALLTK